MSTNLPTEPDKRPRTIDRRWALIAVVVAVVLVVVVLGAYAFLPKSSPAQTGSPSDQSPYAQLFAQIGPNGEVTKEMALEAFSLAIAPLPGVTIPTGAPPTDSERADGTFAVDWLRPFMDQLTPGQAAVVNAALAADPGAPVNTPGLAAALLTRPDLAALVLDSSEEDLTKTADDARKDIEEHLGPLGLPWSLTLNSTETASGGGDTLAYANLHAVVGCSIHVNPSLLSKGDPAFTKATLAHEMFHCFQYDWMEQAGKGGFLDAAPPDWIMEGQAEWVGENIGGPTSEGAATWSQYLTSPTQNLYGRVYDAIGFYQHLAEEAIDPWGHFHQMIAAWENGSNADFASSDAFKAAGAAADTFLDTWASGYFRDSTMGAEWYAAGPWAVTQQAHVTVTVIHPNESVTKTAPALTENIWNVAAASDIIEVHGQNHIRLQIGSVPELPVVQRWLCVKDGGCKCPPGQRYSGPELEEVSVEGAAGGYPAIAFGITGSLDGAQVNVRGHSLDEFCKPLPSENPQTCTSNCGHSNGDPHLRTTNRYAYDFMAAGEFTLLRSPDSSVEIQARQQPYVGDSAAFAGVSINTAIAARDNGHKISVYTTDSGLALHVDSQQVDPATRPDLGPGASIEPISGGIEIDFPDGSVLSALSLGHWGINAVIQSSDQMLSSGMGLLGPITPGGMGVPALPDGSQLPAAPDTETRDKILYSTFADAWRVTDATTLFDYDTGKSTASYTDPNFPSDADRRALEGALASPDPSPAAAAQSACAGLTDSDLVSECEFDVLATGDDGFAQQYGVEQNLYDSGVKAPSPPPPSPGGVTGAQKVVELQDLDGSTIGPDNTLYVSISDSSGAPELLAIDPITAAIKQQVSMQVVTDLHFADGSVWASGQTTDANSQHCSVTRYDPATLADQGDYQIPCTATNNGPPHLTSMGDSVWFIDTTNADPSTGAGTALTQIDPATNTPGKSVPLGYAGGCCQDSQGAVFCSCGQSDTWRLTSTDSAFVDMGNYTQIYPAGTGFWSQQVQQALLIDGPSSSTALPLPVGGNLVGGDPAGIYVQGQQTGQDSNNPLLRQSVDGSVPVQIAVAPTYGSDLNLTLLDYGRAFPSYSLPGGYLHLWLFKETPDSHLALWVQWAPLP